jgi:hypothetical protein
MFFQVLLQTYLRKLIVNEIDVIAGFDHFMAFGTHLADETFQNIR